MDSGTTPCSNEEWQYVLSVKYNEDQNEFNPKENEESQDGHTVRWSTATHKILEYFGINAYYPNLVSKGWYPPHSATCIGTGCPHANFDDEGKPTLRSCWAASFLWHLQ